MKKHQMYMLTTVISLFAVRIANAQEVRNAWERADDHHQIRQDKMGIADDRRDLYCLSDLTLEWDAARKSGNESGAREIMRQIGQELRHDLVETSIQSEQAKREIANSSREVRSDRRELAGDRAEVGKPGEQWDDRRDLRDDRRDRRDDIKDAKEAEKILIEKRRIAFELRNMQRQIDAGSVSEKNGYKKQEKLLNTYLKLSRKEIEMGFRELREDHRELREDRRETWEDRRQR